MLATADASTAQAMGNGRSAVASGITGGGPESHVPIARWQSGSTHRPHPRPQAVPKIMLSYAPDDDTTSGDPDEDDDDDTSKFLNDSDGTHAPIIACLEERAPCPISHECAPAATTAPPSSSLLTPQHLRC